MRVTVKNKMIRVNGDHVKVVTGAHYTPYVDEMSNLSWTNNGGLDNPPTRNIKGSDATVSAIPNLEIEHILSN